MAKTRKIERPTTRTSFWCRIFGHKYKKKLIGEVGAVLGDWMKGEKDTLKVEWRGGLGLAYDEVCERCGKIKEDST